VDLAGAARLSQPTISSIERGTVEQLSVRALRNVLSQLDAGLALEILWRGGALDRLLDQRHAELVATVVDRLAALGWATAVEVTFSTYGERGSIDVLAAHGARSTALVVEVKTAIMSVEETLRRLDAKVRLAPAIAQDRFGWRPDAVGRLLVLPDVSTARRQVERQGTLLERALPDRGATVRRWLATPRGRVAGIVFLSGTDPGTGRRGGGGPHRVRLSRARSGPARIGP
jgi:hypothetical protein